LSDITTYPDLLLAADHAIDDSGIEPSELRRIVKELAPLVLSPIPSLSARAIDLLSRLALSRSGDAVRVPEALDALIPAPDALRDGVGNQSGILTSLLRVWKLHPPLHESVSRFLSEDEYLDVSDGPVGLFLKEMPDYRRTLIAQASHDDSGQRERAASRLATLAEHDTEVRGVVLRLFEDKSYPVRNRAVKGLAPLVAQDSLVRGAMLARLADEHDYVRGAAMDALSPLCLSDMEVREAIIAQLYPPSISCNSAAYALTPVVTDLRVRAGLLALVSDPEIDNQAAALYVLSELADDDVEARELLIQKLDHSNHRIRIAAIEALGGQIEKHAVIRDKLLAFLDDESLRFHASRELSRHAATDPVIQTRIRQIIRHPDAGARDQALRGLSGAFQEHVIPAEEILPVLTDLRCREAVCSHAEAIRAVSAVLQEGTALHALVEQQLAATRGSVRESAIDALSKFLPHNARIRDAVLQGLHSPTREVRASSLRACGPLLVDGEHGASVRTLLVDSLSSTDYYIREAAWRTVAPLIESDASIAAAALAALRADLGYASLNAIGRLPNVNDETSDFIIAQIKGYPNLLDDCSPVVPKSPRLRKFALDLLRSAEGGMRSRAVRALSELVTTDSLVQREIIALLDDPEPYVQHRAIFAVRPLLATETPVLRTVCGKLRHESIEVSWAAVTSLNPLASHPIVRPELRALLNSADSLLKGLALEALACCDEVDLPVQSAVRSFADDPSTCSYVPAAVSRHPALFADLWQKLTPALGRERGAPVSYFGTIAQSNPAVYDYLVGSLSSEDWRCRLSAFRSLLHMEKDQSDVHAVRLELLLADHRGLESWRSRITACGMLLNDERYGPTAVRTLLPALDYCAHLLLHWADECAESYRRQAATALGKLKAGDPGVVARLERMVRDESASETRQCAFDALLTLVRAAGVHPRH